MVPARIPTKRVKIICINIGEKKLEQIKKEIAGEG
jgi:hypothetical protein